MTVNVRPADDVAIHEAVTVLKEGGLVVAPTMTNYVITCDAMNADAVRRVFAAKQRTKLGPLPIGVRDAAMFAECVHVPDQVDVSVLTSVWPSELCLIAPQRADFPDELTCGLRTLACTVSRARVSQALQRSFGGPLAGTSANRSGSVQRVVTLAQAVDQLGDAIDLYLDDGPTPGEVSGAALVMDTIVDLTFDPPWLCREGTFPLARLRELIPDLVEDADGYAAAIAERAAR